jgi:hypothetical protein
VLRIELELIYFERRVAQVSPRGVPRPGFAWAGIFHSGLLRIFDSRPQD